MEFSQLSWNCRCSNFQDLLVPFRSVSKVLKGVGIWTSTLPWQLGKLNLLREIVGCVWRLTRWLVGWVYFLIFFYPVVPVHADVSFVVSAAETASTTLLILLRWLELCFCSSQQSKLKSMCLSRNNFPVSRNNPQCSNSLSKKFSSIELGWHPKISETNLFKLKQIKPKLKEYV